MAERWEPRAYHKQAVLWLLKHPEAGLILDPGLGKTSTTLAAFDLLQKANGARKALIIAPLRVCYLVWSKEPGGELHRWSNFHHLSVALLHGKGREEAAASDSDLYVINPASLDWLVESGTLDSLLKRGLDVLVVDELSAFKHVRTRRFKTLKRYLGRFRRRWGLTGSPAANGLIDLFGQIYVLDLGRSLGRFITQYRNNYFTPSGFGGHEWKLQTGAEERIYDAISDVCFALKVQDAGLDLPPLVDHNLYVNLPPKVRKVYDELEEEFLTYLDGVDEALFASNGAVASGKLRQVASGGVYLPSGEVEHLHDAKSEALVELVDELQGSPLLVPYGWDHDLERIRRALGYDVPALNGDTSGKVSRELARAWNAGELPVLCGHPQAMGHGLNLQGSGSHVCWYSLTWNFELYDQTVRRVWRQGQRRRVVNHRILARKTLDEVVAVVLSGKQRTQDALFTALKDLRRDRGPVQRTVRARRAVVRSSS